MPFSSLVVSNIGNRLNNPNDLLRYTTVSRLFRAEARHRLPELLSELWERRCMEFESRLEKPLFSLRSIADDFKRITHLSGTLTRFYKAEIPLIIYKVNEIQYKYDQKCEEYKKKLHCSLFFG